MREPFKATVIDTMQGERKAVNPATVYRMQGEIKYAIQRAPDITPEKKRDCINALVHYTTDKQFRHCYELLQQDKLNRIIQLLTSKYANKTEINAGAKRKYL